MQSDQQELLRAFKLKPKLDIATISVILWNLFPVIGVFLFGWEPTSVFIFYALETIVVGGFNVLKLMVVYKFGLPPKESETGVNSLGVIPFFIFHYFFFVFVQLTIFFSVSGMHVAPLELTRHIAQFLGEASYNAALGAFATNCVFEFVTVFLGSGIYKQRTMSEQMFEPYPRIFIQQFVVILGGFFLGIVSNGYPVLILFVGIKMYADLLLMNLDLSSLIQSAKE